MKDLQSGLLFVAIALFFVIVGERYPFGSFANPGASLFPTLIGGGLLLLGAYLSTRGFAEVRSSGTTKILEVKFSSLRPLIFITIAVVLFGIGIKHYGVIVATLLVAISSYFAMETVRIRETVTITIAMSALLSLVFVVGLGIRANVFPW